ncbi:MAG: hypothetical protein HPY54_13850 [Chthonomonadetes bacterium]|nr:hypothetical protein [Chthonomonadetes bacterium]
MKRLDYTTRCSVMVRTLSTCLFLLFTAHVVLGYDVNKDLRNLGPPAHDLTVILSGAETVINHYDGYPSGRFQSFATGPVGSNTAMRWDNFRDNDNNIIDTGQTIHVGWSTADHSSHIKDMYWTDSTGQRIRGSVVFNITTGWRYEVAREALILSWRHELVPGEGDPRPILVSNVHMALLPGPVPIEELNAENRMLEEWLQPLPGGESFIVAPGELHELWLPMPPPNTAVVLRYVVEGPQNDFAPQSSAVSVDYVQFIARPPVSQALSPCKTFRATLRRFQCLCSCVRKAASTKRKSP